MQALNKCNNRHMVNNNLKLINNPLHLNSSLPVWRMLVTLNNHSNPSNPLMGNNQVNLEQEAWRRCLISLDK